MDHSKHLKNVLLIVFDNELKWNSITSAGYFYLFEIEFDFGQHYSIHLSFVMAVSIISIIRVWCTQLLKAISSEGERRINTQIRRYNKYRIDENLSFRPNLIPNAKSISSNQSISIQRSPLGNT